MRETMMAKKTAKKKSATKKTAKKPRPKLTNVRNEMTRLRDDLKVIIAAKEDQEGELSATQLEKAKKTKAALDAALKSVTCAELLAPY
jgi:hypothetical protein